MDIQLLPGDVKAQLDAEQRFGPWLCSKYSEKQRTAWWSIWTRTTDQGRRVAAEQLRQSQARAAAQQQQRDAESEERMERLRQRLEHEKKWHREEGETVRISSPQSSLHERPVTVRRMAWEGDTYYAYVLVDPLPANHPLRSRDIRFRPAGTVPIEYRVKADSLQDNV